MKAVTSCLIEFGALIEGDEYQWDGIQLAENNPNGYLIAVILDQGMKAEKVWAIPGKLGWSWENLAKTLTRCGETGIAEDLKREGCRYWRNMAKFVVAAINKLANEYDGSAKNIWSNVTSAKTVYDRFIQFKGIGQKKASMAVNILVRECKINLSLRDIDVSYDKHIRQVFLRSGLADYDDLEHIIKTARQEYPNYPGILDKPAWYIGRDWCFNENPDCVSCPLCDVCSKRTEIKIKEK